MSVRNHSSQPDAPAIAATPGRVSWKWALPAALIALIALIPVTRGAQDTLMLFPMNAGHYGQVLRVTGLAEPGQHIRIQANGNVLARTVANDNGDFAAQLIVAPGTYDVQAVEDSQGMFPERSAVYRVKHTPPRLPPHSSQQSKPRFTANSTRNAVASPTLNTPPATSPGNPITLSGTATAAALVSFYVNGRYTRQTVADGSGNFSTWVPLEDGQNSVYAVATIGSDSSAASNTVETSYTNTIARTYPASTISVPTVWTAGSTPTYTLNGTLTIASGGSLWIQPGVTVSVSGNYKIVAAGGELALRGTASQRVLLRPSTTACTETTPRRTDWVGLETTGSTGRLTSQFADTLCATNGIYFNGGTGSVSDSRLRNGSAGVRMFATNPATLIAPLVSGGNEFTGNTYGLYAGTNTFPIVSGNNLFTANTYGLYVVGNSVASENPGPVVNGNNIYGNSSYNYYTTSFGNPGALVLNARDNWWGSTDPVAISASIRDRKFTTSSPYVDFGGYLAGSGGAPASNEPSLIGPINANATLASGTYQMLGDIVINSGATWTLSPGVTIRSVPGRKVQVATGAHLNAVGSGSQRVHLTSASPYPAKGDWAGIEVLTGATATLDHARVEYAVSAIDFNGGQGTVSNSLLRFNNSGVYIRAKSNPAIQSGNQISHNDYGINIRSSAIASENPLPVVTGNSLFANTTYNFYTLGYATPKPTLNATGNWWGVATTAGIAATIYTAGVSSTTVDVTGYLGAEPFPQAMLVTGLSMSAQQVRPLITQQLAQGQFTINRSGSVTYRVIRDADNAVVREWTQAYGAPGQYSFQWNGFDDQGVAVTGGLYRVALIATDGLDPYVFDVAMPTTTIVPSGSLSATYNPYLNQIYKVNLTFSQPSLTTLRVTPQGGIAFFAVENQFYPAGAHWLYWDGRAPDGSLLTAAAATFATDGQVMRINGVFANTPAIGITGTGTAPNIEVKSDPYLITHSYDQASTIVYRIDADAVVRVTMLPPGIVDPNHASAIVLLNNVAQSARDGNGNPIDHSVTWRGYSEPDFNSVPVAADGAYTFAIEATLPATGRKTVYRGVLNMVQ